MGMGGGGSLWLDDVNFTRTMLKLEKVNSYSFIFYFNNYLVYICIYIYFFFFWDWGWVLCLEATSERAAAEGAALGELEVGGRIRTESAKPAS